MTITTVLPYTRLHSLSSHFDFSFFLIFVNTYRLIFNSGLTKISTSALVNILLPLLGDAILRLILIWEMRKMSRTEVNAWRTSLFNWSISLLWLLWLWFLFEEDCFFKIKIDERYWANVVCKVVIQRENKFTAVSNLVWVCWKAMI